MRPGARELPRRPAGPWWEPWGWRSRCLRGLAAEPLAGAGGKALRHPCPLPTLRVPACDLQEVIQEEPQESPVHPRALVAMEQLR